MDVIITYVNVLSYLCDIYYIIMLLQSNTSVFSNCETCIDKSCAVQMLSNDDLSLLSDNYHEASFEKGEIILSEGSLADHVVYLRSGLVKEYGKVISIRNIFCSLLSLILIWAYILSLATA